MGARIEIARQHVQATNYTTFTTGKSMLGSSTATESAAAIQPIWPGAIVRGTVLTIDFVASISSTSGNTMTITVMLGAIAVFTSDAIKVTTTTNVLIVAYGRVVLTCQATGTGTLAKFMGNGFINGKMIVPPGATPGADYTAGSGSSVLLSTAAQGTGFDSTIQNTLDFNVAMGTSAVGNGWRMEEYVATLGGVVGP